MRKNLPEKIIKRLTLYHFILNEYEELGLEYISSPRFAELLKIDNSQVRKDIKFVNHSGKCKIGYEVKALKKSIEAFLGFQKRKDAFIIGAGNLGSALVKYDDLKNYGLNILALFDNDKSKIGKKVNNKDILDISQLPEFVKSADVEIAILTVPKNNAQESVEFLENAGIKYIWNFTPSVLKVSRGVRIWNENLIGNFLQFIVEDDV